MQSMIRLRDTAEIRRFAQRSKTAALVRLTVRKLFLAREKILPFVVVALSNELAEFYGWEIGLGLDLLGRTRA